MSVRENIQFFHQFDVDTYLEILKEERGAIDHPNQDECYLIDGLPFYQPKWIEDHVSILGFNYVPLPDSLIHAVVNHPELVPDETVVLWLIEQDIFLETTMEKERSNKGN